MMTPSIPGFQWVEQLGSGVCGEVHRFAQGAGATRGLPDTVVAVYYNSDQVDPSLLTEQWQRLAKELPPPGILRPLSWKFDEHGLFAMWPDLDGDDPLDGLPGPAAAQSVASAKVRIKPRRVVRSGEGSWVKGSLAGQPGSGFTERVSDAELQRLTSNLLELGAWLHRHDLVHGSLKPGNVWLLPDHAGRPKPVLLHVGTGAVGRITSLPWSDHLFYMPVDQVIDRKSHEPIAEVKGWDVHAMGVLLYLLWSGRLPRFQRHFEDFRAGKSGALPAPDEWRAEAASEVVFDWRGSALSPEQRDVLERCLKPDRGERWPDLEMVCSEWEKAAQVSSGPAPADSPAAAAAPDLLQESADSKKSGLAAIWLLALGCILLGAGLHAIGSRWLYPDAIPAADPVAVSDLAGAGSARSQDAPATPLEIASAVEPAMLSRQAKDDLLLHWIDQRLDGQAQSFAIPVAMRVPLLDAYRQRISALEPPVDLDQRVELAVALEIRGHVLELQGQLAAAEAALGQAVIQWQRALEELGGMRAASDLNPRPLSEMDSAENRLAAVHEARGRWRRLDGRTEPAMTDLLAAARLRNGMLRRAPDPEERAQRTRAAGRCWLEVADARRELRDLTGAADALAEVEAMLQLMAEDEAGQGESLVWLRAGNLHQRGNLARAAGDAATAIERHHEAAQVLVDHIARAIVVPLEFQKLLGRVYTELAELVARLDDPGQAIDAHGAAIRHFFAVLAAEPQDRTARLYLARNYGELAFIERDLGQVDEAMQHLDAAVQMLDGLPQDPPPQAAEILSLAVLQATLADLTMQQGDGTRALEQIEGALELVSHRLETDAENFQPADLTRWRMREAELTETWADIALSLEHQDRAIIALELALERWRALRQSPDVNAERAQRGIVHNRTRLDELIAAAPAPPPPVDPLPVGPPPIQPPLILPPPIQPPPGDLPEARPPRFPEPPPPIQPPRLFQRPDPEAPSEPDEAANF